MELKDKAKLKDERRTQKRGEVRTTKGPEIAWDLANVITDTPLPGTPDPEPPASDDDANNSNSNNSSNSNTPPSSD